MNQDEKLRVIILEFLSSETALATAQTRRDTSQKELCRAIKACGRDVILANRRFHIHDNQLCIKTHDAIVLSEPIISMDEPTPKQLAFLNRKRTLPDK